MRLWAGTNRQLERFFQRTNNIHKTMRSILETETNNTLNFIDLSIKKKQDTQTQIQFLRNVAYIDTIIRNSSYKPTNKKHHFVTRFTDHTNG